MTANNIKKIRRADCVLKEVNLTCCEVEEGIDNLVYVEDLILGSTHARISEVVSLLEAKNSKLKSLNLCCK